MMFKRLRELERRLKNVEILEQDRRRNEQRAKEINDHQAAYDRILEAAQGRMSAEDYTEFVHAMQLVFQHRRIVSEF